MIGKILRESTIYGIVGALSAFTGTFVTPIYTRMFDPSDYAILDFLIASLVILTIISGAWIDAGLARNYYLAKESDEIDALISTGIILSVISIAAFVVLSIATYLIFLEGFANTNWSTILPLLVILLPRRLHVFALQIFRLGHDPKNFLIIAIGQIIVSTSLSIWFGILWGFVGVLWAYAVGRFIFAIVGLFILRSQVKFHFDFRMAKQALVFGIPLLPAFLSQWVQNYAGRIILIATVTLTQVSHFSLALKIASFASIFLLAFNQAWIPYYNEMLDRPEGGQQFPRMLNYYLIGMLFVAIGISAFSNILVQLFGTIEYLPAVPLITFIAMGIIWDGSLKIIDAGISKVRKTQWTGYAVLIGWLVYLVTSMTLVSWYGPIAIAMSYLVGTSMTALLILYFAQKLCPMPYNKTIICGTFIASWVISFSNIFIFSKFESSNVRDLTPAMISLSFGLAVWLLLVWRFIQTEDIDSIKEMAVSYLQKQKR